MTPLWMLGLPAPDPLPQPGPTWLMWTLLLVTFLLHLVAMNLALGGSVIAAAVRLRLLRPEAAHAQGLVTWFARALPTLFAATITFGVAPLLFLQVLYGRAFFGSAILMAWPWLSVIGLLLLAYSGAYRLALADGQPSRWHTAVATVIAVALLLVAFIYSNNMSLMLSVDRFEQWTADGVGGWHWNVRDATLLPRVLHMVLGAIAVAGVGLALLGVARRRVDAAFAHWAMQAGAGWTAVTTLLNLMVGFWWTLALPREVLLQFMGRDPAAAVALMVGVMLGMVTLALAAMAWRAARPAPLVQALAATMAGTLVAMVISRDQVRASTFALVGLEPSRWIEPQWGLVAIFFACLLAALGIVGWMGWMLARATPARPEA